MGSASPPEGLVALDSAIDRALGWLLAEAGRGFPSARHCMDFPSWAGFSGGAAQCGDGFARAVAAGAMADAAQALSQRSAATASALTTLARREADALAGARLTDRGGGWSYFPDLPELPPDLDSLSAVTGLFARVAPEHLPLTARPIDMALASRGPAGGCRTWLIDPDDPPAARERMQHAVARHWGDTVDVDVNARFADALAAVHRAGAADSTTGSTAAPTAGKHGPATDAAAGVAAFVRAAQQADGLWPVTWYWSPLVSTDLALADPELPDAAREAALQAVLARQHADGGWGEVDSATLETALAVTLLAERHPAAAGRGARWLSDNQTRRGAWRASPWIRMDVGRAGGRGAGPGSVYSARFGSELIETAFALRALARLRGLD